MGENSQIEWTDHTFNPWMGCTKVSAGCTHCYAEREMDHRYGRVKWGPQGTRIKTGESYWRQPYKWQGRVFCASVADVFEDRPELIKWRQELYDLTLQTSHLTWMLLTKRPENVRRMWPTFEHNVWIGTSIEDQETADERIPHLLETPEHTVIFLSCEPLLGPITIPNIDDMDWVIAGGESGPKARPTNPDWVRGIRDQCLSVPKVSFFFKQWGEWGPFDDDVIMPAGVRTLVFPDGQVVRRVGRKAAGRLLDGKEWNEIP